MNDFQAMQVVQMAQAVLKEHVGEISTDDEALLERAVEEDGYITPGEIRQVTALYGRFQ